ncbi:MAG: maleylpyruvate isomerase family mycothiol-dependent enzyme [Acidimicrobiia bacterium]|nr:maleylpyruvate isomerase family mycothiol-dependent enzyme [Acidimicrobiia bacterium]
MLDRDTLLGSFWRDGLGLAAAAERAGLDAPVASCPEWSVADLVWHTGEVQQFWSSVITNRWEDPSAYEEPDRPAAADLVAWYSRLVDTTLEVLRSTDPDTTVWSWAPRGGTAGWVTRRMAQEVAVHRWDAEVAAGDPPPIEAEVASDGIDEFFEHFTDSPAEGAAPLDGSVHLHCTDVDGEWVVTEPDPAGRLHAERVHAKGDAAIRGPASDLLLALWRRRPLDLPSIEVIGDGALAERLVARTDLS